MNLSFFGLLSSQTTACFFSNLEMISLGGQIASLLIFGNLGSACMSAVVTHRPRLRQCTFRRRERRMRLFYVDGTGFIDFCEKFKYLGSILHYSLTSDADVDKRVASATAAFGALKNIFNSKYL